MEVIVGAAKIALNISERSKRKKSAGITLLGIRKENGSCTLALTI
jgi:hypothetical protein